MADAPIEARAVMLADKLHNLLSIACDVADALPIWSHFHADRTAVLDYYRSAIDRLGVGEPRLQRLAANCRRILDEIDLAENRQTGSAGS